ncbi:MAG: thiamine phosphate synthase [bacterium]
MKPRRALLQAARLYGILDTSYAAPDKWPALTEQLISGGVQVLQIRAKSASEKEIIQWTQPLLPLVQNILLILNDYPHLVPELGADGCHIGQDDLSVAEARQQAGEHALVGKSTHSVEQALAAEKEGADYIGFGPLFATPTKPTAPPIGLSLIQETARRVAIPQFCIGGIKLENIPAVLQAGAQRVVIVSGLLTAPSPTKYAQAVCHLLRH